MSDITKKIELDWGGEGAKEALKDIQNLAAAILELAAAEEKLNTVRMGAPSTGSGSAGSRASTGTTASSANAGAPAPSPIQVARGTPGGATPAEAARFNERIAAAMAEQYPGSDISAGMMSRSIGGGSPPLGRAAMTRERGFSDEVLDTRGYEEYQRNRMRRSAAESAAYADDRKMGLREVSAYAEDDRRQSRSQRDMMRHSASEASAYTDERRMGLTEVSAYAEDERRQTRTQRQGMARARSEDAAYADVDRMQSQEQRRGMSYARSVDSAYSDVEREQRQAEQDQARVQRAGMSRAGAEDAAYAEEEKRNRPITSGGGSGGRKSGRSPMQIMGMLYRGMAYTGMGYEAVEFARETGNTIAAGRPYYANEHLGEILGIAGGALGGLTGPMGMLAGGVVGTGIGDFASGVFSGNREYHEKSLSSGIATGFSAKSIGSIANEWSGGTEAAPQGYLAALSTLVSSSRLAGTTFGGRTAGGPRTDYMGIPINEEGGLPELPREYKPFLNRMEARHGVKMTDAMSALSPALSDPFYNQSVIREGTQPGSLGTGNVQGMIDRFGATETIKMLSSMPVDETKNLAYASREASYRRTEESNLGIASASATGAGATVGGLTAAGLGANDPRSVAAQDAYVKTLDALAKEQESLAKHFHDMGNKTADTVRAAGEATAAATEARTKATAAAREISMARTNEAVSLASLGAESSGLALSEGSFVLAPGQGSPDAPRNLTKLRALRQAQYAAVRNPYASPVERAQATVAAEQTGVGIRQAKLVEYNRQTFGVADFYAGEEGMSAANLGSAALMGGGEGTLQRLSAGHLAELAGELAHRRRGLADAERHPELGIGWRDLQAQRERINTANIDYQQTRNSMAMRSFDFTDARIQRESAVLESNVPLRQMKMQGPVADTATAAERARLIDTGAISTLNRIGELTVEQRTGVDHRDEIEKKKSEYQIMRNESKMLRYQAGGEYQPSGKLSLGLQSMGLGISLQESDPAYGGQVSSSMRRGYIGLLAQQAGEIEAKMYAPGTDDAQRARLFPQYAQTLQAQQEQKNKLQFGDASQLINRSFGATGNQTFWGPSYSSFQRYTPGNSGARALGGTGEGVGVGPFAMEALMAGGPQTAAGLLGGLSKEDAGLAAAINGLVNFLRGQATGSKKGASAPPNAFPNYDNRPDAMAVRAADGSYGR